MHLTNTAFKLFFGFRSSFFLVLAVFAGLSVSAQTTPPDSDFQIWHDSTLVIPVYKQENAAGQKETKVSLLLLGTLRLGQNRLYPVDRRLGAGISFKLNKNWTVMPSYLYINSQALKNGRKATEHRLRIEAEYERKWSKFSIKDRNRVEYRVRNSRSDSVRYRNKFTLKIPVKSNGKELFAPFVADEVFYDFTAKEFSRNEFSAGISKKLSSNTSADFFYMRQDNASGTIRSINAIGVNLKFTID